MGIYCNEKKGGGFGKVTMGKCMDCAQRNNFQGGLMNCPCLGDGYFGHLQFEIGNTAPEGLWSCGSARPQTDDENEQDSSDRRTVSESDLNRIVKRTINESQLLLERPCGGGQPCSGDCCQQEGGNGIHVSNGCMAAKSNGRVYCDFSCPSGTSKKACGGGNSWDTGKTKGVKSTSNNTGGDDGEVKASRTRLSEQNNTQLYQAAASGDAQALCQLCKLTYWTSSERNKYCRCSTCTCSTGQIDNNLLCTLCNTQYWNTSDRNKHCRCSTCVCRQRPGVPTTTNLGVDKDFRGPSEFDSGGAQSHELNPGAITPYSKVDGVLQEETNRNKDTDGRRTVSESDLNRIVRRVVNESHLLTEGPYCNPDGANASSVAGCHKRGVGCLGDGFFGIMGQCTSCDPEWACVSVAPGGTGGGPLNGDDLVVKTKGNSPEEDNCPEGLWNPVSRHCFGKKEARNTDMMGESNTLREDITNLKRLMGYNPSLTLTEQATGGSIPICMGITAQGCPGTPEANTSMTTPTTKCATIDNIPVTANDVGRDIMAPMGGPHMTVQSVFPNVTGNGSENVSSAPGPCPRPNTPTTDPYYCVGGVAGMGCVQSSGTPGGTTTGGPFNTLADCQTSGCGGSTTTTCNKTCQQLVPGFKKKVGNKPCNWLNNRLNAFTRKLSTKTPGSCGAKRITCKIGVVKELLQNLGC